MCPCIHVARAEQSGGMYVCGCMKSIHYQQGLLLESVHSCKAAHPLQDLWLKLVVSCNAVFSHPLMLQHFARGGAVFVIVRHHALNGIL